MNTSTASHHGNTKNPANTMGMLAIWHGTMEGAALDFDDWYDRQHHIERLGIAGFVRARRYVNADEGVHFFVRYDVASSSVLESEKYLHAVNNPTEWTTRIMPQYRDTTRVVFQREHSAGEAEGGYLITVRWNPEERHAPSSDSMAAMAQKPGVLTVETWTCDTHASTIKSKEKTLRPGPDAQVSRVMLVEGSDLSRMTAAVEELLLPKLSHAPTIDRFHLAFCMANPIV